VIFPLTVMDCANAEVYNTSVQHKMADNLKVKRM